MKVFSHIVLLIFKKHNWCRLLPHFDIRSMDKTFRLAQWDKHNDYHSMGQQTFRLSLNGTKQTLASICR